MLFATMWAEACKNVMDEELHTVVSERWMRERHLLLTEEIAVIHRVVEYVPRHEQNMLHIGSESQLHHSSTSTRCLIK